MARALTLSKFLCSSVGKKTLVALTGLALSGFVLMHMLGNLLLFAGAETYNKYSHALVTNPLIYIAEVKLVILFLLHLGLALRVTIENKKSRLQGYQTLASRKQAAFASKSMWLTGLLTFAFVVVHLATFKFGPHYSVVYAGVEMRDIYRLVMEKFQNPFYSGWYFLCLIVLGVHLSHGIAASLQTLGLFSRLNCRSKGAAVAIAVFVTLGFISQPILALIRGVN